MNRNDTLRKMIESHNWTRKEVCQMLKIPVAKGRHSSGTLDDWLADRTEIPEAKLELLQIKAAQRHGA